MKRDLLLSTRQRLLPRLQILLVLLFPACAAASPYCECEVQCFHPSGGFAFTCSGAAGETKEVWTSTFDYKVDDGDPYGGPGFLFNGTLTTAASYRKDCLDQNGIAQKKILSHSRSVCRSKTDWSSWVATGGSGIRVDAYYCKYRAK